jgi:arylsulfatase A-like enzyme
MRLKPIQDAQRMPATREAPSGRAPEAAPAPAVVRLGPSHILALAMWFGVLTGLAEIAAALLRVYRYGQPVREFPDLLWMAPAADALLMAFPGVLLALGAWFWPRLGTLRLVAFVYLSVAFFGLLLRGPALHNYARTLLALGLAAQVSRFLARRPGLLGRLLGWTTGWAWPAAWCRSRPVAREEDVVDRRQVLVGSTAAVAGLAAGVYGGRWLAERRSVAALAPADPGRPNVLLLVLDTVRAQSLSLHGYARPTSPSLERLARQGVCFRRAIAPAPWTLPSHAAMFTGRRLHETRVNFDTPYTARHATLAEVLRGRGYQTAGFVGNTIFLCPAFGLHRGFDHHECFGRSLGTILQASALGYKVSNDKRIREFLGYFQYPGRRNAAQLNKAVLDWLDGRDRRRPFFAFVNYFDAHTPYIPSKEAVGRFAPTARAMRQNDLQRTFSADELKDMQGCYDECILGLDLEVGRLLDRLRERGDLENTVVVLTSDHGEHLGEHGGLVDHGFSLYAPLLHVPLIIIPPSRAPAGEVISQPVSLLDLPATVCDVVGLGDQGHFPGNSLTSLWKGGRAVRVSMDMPSVSEAEPSPFPIPRRYPLSKGTMRSLVWRDYHYIRNGDGGEELYHMGDDPQEESNLVGSGAARVVLPRLRVALKNA